MLDQTGQPGGQALIEARQLTGGAVLQIAQVDPSLEHRKVGPNVRTAQLLHTLDFH
jgi:hypothetical protein